MKRNLVMSKDLWMYPEWRALADRLGIHDVFMSRCVIETEVEYPVKITVEHYGNEPEDAA